MLYRYRLYLEDGSDAGEAHYAVLIQPGETDLGERWPQVARARCRANRGEPVRLRRAADDRTALTG
jgi:hypothetical protein